MKTCLEVRNHLKLADSKRSSIPYHQKVLLQREKGLLTFEFSGQPPETTDIRIAASESKPGSISHYSLHCYFSPFRAMADSAEASAASEAPVQAEEDGFVVVQSASALPSTGIVTRTQFLSC